MRHSAKLVRLATLAALLVPTVSVVASQPPGSSTYSQTPLILAQSDNAAERLAEADYLLEQGIQQFEASQFQEAVRSFQAALEIYQNPDVQDAAYWQARPGEGDALNNLGLTYTRLGQYPQAIRSFMEAINITHEFADVAERGEIFGNLGDVYYQSGMYSNAFDLYERQLEITRELGDRVGEGNALLRLGNAYVTPGLHERGITLIEQSLTIFRELNYPTGEGAALSALGRAYNRLGQYSRAIEHSEQSLDIFRQVNNRYLEADVFANLGSIYSMLGQIEQSIDFYEQGLSICNQVGDRQCESSISVNLGNIHLNFGEFEEAIPFYEQSLTFSREVGDRAREIAALRGLANAYNNLQDYQRAAFLYFQAIDVIRSNPDVAEAVNLLGDAGIFFGNQGHDQIALEAFQVGLNSAREIGDRAGEGAALNNRGAVLLETGQFPEAESNLRQSVEAFEALRANLSDDQLISIADTQAQAYANLEQALIAQDKTDEALAITERGRGRAFVLQLASRLSDESERAALESSPVARIPTVAEIQQIARDTNTTLVTYSQIFDQALYIWVVQPTGEIELRSVEFEGAGEGGTSINPIASIDGPVYRSATPDSALTALVTNSRSAVNESGNPNTPQLQELHQVLIDPIADLLPSDPNAQVVFIPQGQLFLVPFAALQDSDGTYLIEKHTILTAPSIQVFGLANDAVGTRNAASLSTDNALIVGNPTMPTVWLPNKDGDLTETQLSYLSGAKAEAEAIGNFFNIPALTGEQATEARIKQELPNASLIHLATHGLLEYGIPESSGVLDLPGAIALAPGNGEDGLLTSAEILEMDLQADLAILSACDTGRGRITGDGVVGLSRALITAGVPSVMVSLWAVNDDSTSLLMQRFYEFLATGELTKAEALRQAQLSLLYDEDTETRLEAVRADISIETSGRRDVPTGSRHPYHWAPFILIGNGL